MKGEAPLASPSRKLGIVERELVPSVNQVVPLAAPVVAVRMGDFLMSWLVDSGAEVSLVTLDVVQRSNCMVRRSSSVLNSASGHSINVIGEVELIFSIGDQEFAHDFVVVTGDRVSFLAVLGTDFFGQKGAKIDYQKFQLSFAWGAVPLRGRSPSDGMVYMQDLKPQEGRTRILQQVHTSGGGVTTIAEGEAPLAPGVADQENARRSR